MAENSDLFHNYEDFWPFYLSQHSHRSTRFLHMGGTILGVFALMLAVFTFSLKWLLAAFVLGYGFAWLSHSLIEKNRPATFTHPFWSLRGDFHMLNLFLKGELDAELKKHGMEI